MSGSRVSLISLPHCAAPPPLTRAARGARLFQDVDSLHLRLRPARPAPASSSQVMQYLGRLSLVTSQYGSYGQARLR